MIQVLTYSGFDQDLQGDNVVINSLHDAKSLDEFKINVINLQDEELWQSELSHTHSIRSLNDLKSLAIMIQNSVKTDIIILFPQNCKFIYNMRTKNSAYWESCDIKDILPNIGDILSNLFEPINDMDVVYENTITKIDEEDINASFYFNEIDESVLTTSVKSEKPTTVRCSKVILSTLKLEKYESVIGFLKSINLLKEKEELPEWMKEVKMFDDDKQYRIIEQNNQTITIANANITKAMEVINKNNKYKSVLYTTGDQLVNVVFQILEEILGCNLSEFHDKKKEDFNFVLGDKVFIGEIKGVTPNVKKANVSQLDVHVQEYSDEHGIPQDNMIALLIINHQRNKSLLERETVHDDVIKIAERNGSLIIETYTLLKLFEKYLNGEKTREECIDIFKNNVGLLLI